MIVTKTDCKNKIPLASWHQSCSRETVNKLVKQTLETDKPEVQVFNVVAMKRISQLIFVGALVCVKLGHDMNAATLHSEQQS